MARLSRSWLGYADGLAVDGLDNAIPASERFFETEFHCRDEIVATALESRMFFLLK